MLKRTFAFFTVTLLWTLLAIPANAEVTAEPHGFATWFENNEAEPLEVPVVLTNDGEADVGFRLRLMPVRRDQERRRAGPRRDDPGEVLRELELDHAGILGIARDFENDGLMWVTHTIIDGNGVPAGGMFTCYQVNDEGVEAVAEIVPGGVIYPLGGTYFNGVLYATVWQNMYIIRYDLEGNNLGNVNLADGEYAMGFCVDPERALLFCSVYPAINIVVLDIINNYNRVGVIQNVCGAANQDTRVRLGWVPEHEDGHLWCSLQRPGQDPFTAWQLSIDEDFNWEEVQHFQADTDTRSFGIGHDGTDLWIGRLNEATVAVTDDGINEPRWLLPEVEEGLVSSGEGFEVNFAVTPVGLADGLYEVNVVFTLDDPAEPPQPQIIMTVLMSLNTEVASLSGIVSDPARNDQPLAGVNASLDTYLMQRRTDENGAYAYENLPLGNYQVTFTAPDYLPLVEEIALEEAGEYELNIGLLHSECVLNPNRIATQLQPDMTQEFNITLANPGNGPLTFTAERRLLGEADAQPWELRRSYPISEITADPRIGGIAFLDDHFYVTGHANGAHLIYILDREGNITGRFNQLGQSQYGMQDLAWDGQWLWGSGERRIFGFTPDGQQQVMFEGLFSPMVNFAWDTDRDILWASGSTTDIVGYTRQGQQVARLNRRSLRQYGLAYWPDDPDGYPLYIFHSPAGNMMVVTKMNPASNDTLPVRVLEGVGRAASVEITNELDVYSWVFMAVANADANDRIDIWQLDTRIDWMAVEPTEGVVEAGGNLGMTLTLDAANLPLVRFEGEILFTHNGVGGSAHLPIALDVVLGQVHTERTLTLNSAWNMISLNVDPDEHDIRALWQPLVQAGRLVMLKDGTGRFYRPEWNFCNIPGWVVSEGYQARMTEACELVVPGTSMLPDEPIQLAQGWQIIAYYPRDPVAAPVGFAGIAEDLYMAKDVQGHFYLPAWGFNNMDPLREG